jgi:P-type Cu+ transporter
VQRHDKGYQVINERIEALRGVKRSYEEETSIILTVVLICLLVGLNMVLPIIPLLHHLYMQFATFPKAFGIYSTSVLLNIALTAIVVKVYALAYMQRAYDNYREFRATNMETLIALGSLSALALAFFYLVRYSIDLLNHTIPDVPAAIMDINDALTSASIIVLVVTVGKYVERQAKLKIEKMTDEIFPESVLFKDMSVTYV